VALHEGLDPGDVGVTLDVAGMVHGLARQGLGHLVAHVLVGHDAALEPGVGHAVLLHGVPHKGLVQLVIFIEDVELAEDAGEVADLGLGAALNGLDPLDEPVADVQGVGDFATEG